MPQQEPNQIDKSTDKKGILSLLAVPTMCLGLLTGCSNRPLEKSEFVEGRVVENTARVVLDNSPDRAAGNPLLQQPVIRVDDGNGKRYTFEIYDNYDTELTNDGPVTPHSLAMALEIGTVIKFPTKIEGQSKFSQTGIGLVDADFVEIVSFPQR